MAIKLAFQPIKDAVLKNLNNKDPDAIVFYVGSKAYKAKDLIKHFAKEDKIAEDLIETAVKVNNVEILDHNPTISQEVIDATVKMFG